MGVALLTSPCVPRLEHLRQCMHMCEYAYCTVCRFTVPLVCVCVFVNDSVALSIYTVALKYYVIVFGAELITSLPSLEQMYQQTDNWLKSV